MSSYLTKKQVDLLLQRIHPKRVLQRDGNSYVEGHDIKAELNRVFGFGRWSSEVVEQVLLFEEETVTKSTNKPAWYVAYRSVVKLTVCAMDGTILATYTEGHVGDSTHPVRGEAHGNAVTNSETYALKRAAIPLGDQFGLGLYNKGSQAALVRWTLVPGVDDDSDHEIDTEDVPEVAAESEQAEPQQDPRITNAPRAEQPTEPPAAEPEPVVEDPPADMPDPLAKEEQRRQAIAEQIRAAALADPPDEWTRSSVQWITHLMGEAVKNKVHTEKVQSLLSEDKVALRVMLEQRLKNVTDAARAAS